MFYDHENGPAAYDSPAGEVRGEMLLKRQFRIRDGRMELMLESALHIVDDVLQQELSRASGEGMRNIVATIQRDQNAIIRNDQAPVLIIRGVAGSGKSFPTRATGTTTRPWIGIRREDRSHPVATPESISVSNVGAHNEFSTDNFLPRPPSIPL